MADLKSIELKERKNNFLIEHALEEIKIHQEVIARKERNVQQIRGWLMTLITALVASMFVRKGLLTPPTFVVIGSSMVIAFLCIEIFQYRPIRRASQRVQEIEIAIENGNYSGPVVSRMLGQRLTVEEWKKELKGPNVWLHYGLFLGIIVLLAWKTS